MWAAFGPPTCGISPRTAFPALDCDVESPPSRRVKVGRLGKAKTRPSRAEARLARLRASLPIGHACRTLFEEEEP